MNLDGMSCIVTGGASGIGEAIVERFLAEGAHVTAVDRDSERLRQLADGASATGRLSTANGSVDDPAFAARTIAELCGTGRSPDCLVTAAAISIGGAAADTTEAAWDEVFSVNVKGTFIWCKAVLPHFVDRKKGSIITLASQLALSGGRGNASYVAAKGAIVSLTRSIALDYAEEGIRANALVPGAIDTPMLRRAFARNPDPAGAESRSLARHPLGRFGTAAEVAAAAVFLASSESSFTTGALLPVDGGWLAA